MGKPPFKKDDKVGPYIIEGTFSIGGMGVVYTTKGGKVLIKSPFADAEQMIIEQFQEEVEALKQLNHPNIVRILDSGKHNGIPWYAMEKLEGETLRDKLKREYKLSPTEALRIEYQIVQAMAYAHSREKPVLHRDLKPENICFRGDTPVILDFGLARLGTDSSIILSPHGTLLYMAPEQMRGRTDARTDVYALGVILYEMICGHPPFIKTSQDESDASVIEKIIDLNTPAPKLTDVDESISAICEKALNKRAEFRYADATEMVADIKFALRKHLKRDAMILEQKKEYQKAAELLREAVEYGLPMTELEEFWKFRLGRPLRIILINKDSIEPAKKAMELKDHPNLIPILEIVEGKYPYLVVQSLTTDPLIKRISQGCYLSFRECIQLCQAIVNSLTALKKANLYFSLEERRIFPGTPFKIAGLHRARIGYKEISAQRLAKILVRGLSGTLDPDWEEFPDVFRDILYNALQGNYLGDAISLAKDIENAWNEQERKLEEIRNLKNKILENIEKPDKKVIQKLLDLLYNDPREAVRTKARNVLEELFEPGPPDGNWRKYFEETETKCPPVTKRLGKFLGTLFQGEDKKQDNKTESKESLLASEFVDYFEKNSPDPHQLTATQVKKLFEQFFREKQRESTQKLEKERAKLLRTIAQKDELINELEKEKERLQNILKERENLLQEQQQITKRLEERQVNIFQSITKERKIPETSETIKTGASIDLNELCSLQNFKFLKKYLLWSISTISNACEQILSHLGGQRRTLTVKEKQIEEKVKIIIEELIFLKEETKKVKALSNEISSETIIKLINLFIKLEEKREIIVDMIKKENISRNYGGIYIPLG